MVNEEKNSHDFMRGFIDMLPMTIAAAPFGLMVGTLAAQKGLDGWDVLLMSSLVYAGASQFMALDMWASPVPILAIIGATALINLRHLMMGAALGPHICHLPRWAKWSFVCVMSDETWATGLTTAASRKLTSAYVMGVILPFYLAWLLSSVLGVSLGNVMTDPTTYGLDFVFTAVLIAMTMGFWKRNRHTMALIVAATVALAVHHFIGGVWHIFAGGLAGTLTAALVADDILEEEISYG